MTRTRSTDALYARENASRGFTILELILAATIMTVILIGIFQIVAAILVPWTRETDRITRAQQGNLALELIVSDLTAIWTTGDDAVLHLEGDSTNSLLKVLRQDGEGHLTAVAYWLSRENPFDGGPRPLPSLFRGELPPEDAWERMRGDDLDWIAAEPLENFIPGGDLRQAILSTHIARMEITVVESADAADPGASPDPAVTLQSLSPVAPSSLPFALDLRLVILSAQGARRMEALRDGQPEFLSDTEASIEEAFGQAFSRRLVLHGHRADLD
ncbi:MAG: type II secretion system protein [Opitutales bacterium]|nr:type II secretion system protein [Opitutales bacterium]